MPMVLLRRLLGLGTQKKMRLRPRVIRACTRAELTVFRLLRHWRPSSWANRESSRTIVAECSACQTWIIVKRQFSIASARQLRAESTSTPSTSSSRLVLLRAVVRYRMYLESRHLAANTINQHLAAVRCLAHEAADAGLLSPELAAGISRVKASRESSSSDSASLHAASSTVPFRYLVIRFFLWISQPKRQGP
jgi:hypothetical protein